MTSPRRILLVDDNPDDRLLVARELRNQLPGVEIAHAGDAAALERALAADDFDVVVTDYQLGWSTGTEVLKRVKERSPRKPVIMFTATGSEEIAVEAMKEGLDDYITKTTRHYAGVPHTVLACHERAQQRVRLEELLQALTERQRELEQVDAQKNRFLVTLAHELRNPLGAIRFSAGLLREGAAADVLRRAREVIERQTAHLARLLDDLLDLSRISHNLIELRRRPLDLRTIVHHGVHDAMASEDDGRHAWSLELPEQPLMVDGDPTRLAQVVANLLDNAAQFTPAGGRIRVRAQVSADAVVLEVSDTGRGIAPEELDAVFEMFTRADAAKLSTGPPGLGIGLSVVRNLVRLHGGEIAADSPGEGQGSVFTVRLPPASPAP